MPLLKRSSGFILLLLVISVQLYAGDDSSLRKHIRPFTEQTVETVRKAVPTVFVCIGALDSNSKPYIGHIKIDEEDDSLVCKYSKLEDGSPTSTKYYDSHFSEWLDLDFDSLLAWLEKNTASRQGSDQRKFYTFTYWEMTGSPSLAHNDDVILCAKLTQEKELQFGYQVTLENNLKDCRLATKAIYHPKNLLWDYGFYQTSEAGWSADKRRGGLCSTTKYASSISKENCAKAARDRASVKGFCLDTGGACGLIEDVIDTSDKDGGRNTCYLKHSVKQEHVYKKCRFHNPF